MSSVVDDLNDYQLDGEPLSSILVGPYTFRNNKEFNAPVLAKKIGHYITSLKSTFEGCEKYNQKTYIPSSCVSCESMLEGCIEFNSDFIYDTSTFYSGRSGNPHDDGIGMQMISLDYKTKNMSKALKNCKKFNKEFLSRL